MSVCGRGHPKTHRLWGPQRPQLGVPPQSLTRPDNVPLPPPEGGKSARAPARLTLPTPPGAGDDNADRSPGEGTGNAAELATSIPRAKQHCSSLRALASETPTDGARPTARRRPAAAAALGSGTAHTGSASGTSGNDPEHPRSTEAEARHRAEAARRQPSPTREGPHTRPIGHPERAASGKHPLRQRTPGARSRPDSAPPPLPAPRTGGEARRGTRRQDEKSRPIRHECPSLAWRGFGPAQESAKSPHRSAEWAGEARGAGGDPARTASKRSLLRPHRPHTPGRAADDTERGTPDTRHGAMEASVVTPPSVPAARSARAVKDHPPPPPPPSGAAKTGRPEVAPPRGRSRCAKEPSHAGPGKQLKRERVRATPSAQSPARTQRPKLPPSGGTRQRTTCQHLPDGRKRPTRANPIATGATGNSSLTTAAFPEQSHGQRTAKSSPSPRSRAPRDNWSTLVNEGENKETGTTIPSEQNRGGGRGTR